MDAAGEGRLIARAQAGDQEALGELLMARREACYALALRLTASPDEAEDVCQEAFMNASRHIGSYRPVGRFGSWLYRIVVNSHGHRSASESARRQRERDWSTAHGEGNSQTGDAARSTLREHLDRCLARLDRSRRLPIVLHYERGLSYAEAAAVLDMPEGTVATNIKRGLEELKELMTAAGYACTVPALTGVLTQAAPVVVPAGLTAFIQGLAGAGTGLGKAAVAEAVRASARLGVKKAAGLALGWKMAGIVAVVGVAAVTAIALRPADRRPPGVAPADGIGSQILFQGFYEGQELEPFWAEKTGAVKVSKHALRIEAGTPTRPLAEAETGVELSAALLSRPIAFDGRPISIQAHFEEVMTPSVNSFNQYSLNILTESGGIACCITRRAPLREGEPARWKWRGEVIPDSFEGTLNFHAKAMPFVLLVDRSGRVEMRDQNGQVIVFGRLKPGLITKSFRIRLAVAADENDKASCVLFVKDFTVSRLAEWPESPP